MYLTIADMYRLFEHRDLVEACSLRESVDTVDDSRLGAAIEGAEGIVNGYLIQAFNLPLVEPTPEFLGALRIHAANITIWVLGVNTELTQIKYQAAIEYLKSLIEKSGGGDGSSNPGAINSPGAGSRFSVPRGDNWRSGSGYSQHYPPSPWN